jgi:3-phosphoshikimate 1-carboxyvinyltransferase
MPQHVVVEGDWSSAAFWVVAGVTGKSPVTVCGMNNDSLQGDSYIVEHLRSMGAFIECNERGVVAMPSHLLGAELDCTDTPDLVPVLAVAAAVAQGTTLFTGVGRLRYKESDRLAAVKDLLAAFGIASQIGEDTFTVYGGEPMATVAVDSYNDHRIAMSLSITALRLKEPLNIKNKECVSKSYPSFFEDLELLKAGANE